MANITWQDKIPADPGETPVDPKKLWSATNANEVKAVVNGKADSATVTALVSTVNTHTTQINSLLTRMTAAENSIVTLTSNLAALTTRVTTAEANIAAMNTAIISLQSAVQDLNDRVTDLEALSPTDNNNLPYTLPFTL